MNVKNFAYRISASMLILLSLTNQSAAGDTFSVSADQIARLGVVLGRPELVANMEVASAPAEVVIPPTQQAVVSTPVGGLISRLLVATGEAVVSGQALAEIRSAQFLDLQREYLDAVAASDLAEAQLERDVGLHDDGIIAMRRLQETTATARTQRLLRDQARQQLHLAGLDDSQIDTLNQLRELSPTLILNAPFDGVVVTQNAGIGASVDALDPVLGVADLRRLWLEVRLAQELAERIAIGMQVATGLGQPELFGSIVNIGQIVDSATQTVLVRAAVENADAQMRAGQFLAVEILAQTGDTPAFAIPGGASTRVGADTFVFARTADGFEVLAVEQLAVDGDRLYIDGDIDEATEIAVGGVSALKSLWMSLQEEGS